MEAPNITMPRSSSSTDAIELDLGSLRLSNAVAWRNGDSVKDLEVLTKPLIPHPVFVLVQVYHNLTVHRTG